MKSNALFSGYIRPLKGRVGEGTQPELCGSKGHILPFDDEGSILTVYTKGKHRFRKLVALLGAVVFTEGDGEGTVHIPIELLDRAAEIIGARRKRNLSTQQREDMAERARRNFALRKLRHKKGNFSPGDETEGESRGESPDT